MPKVPFLLDASILDTGLEEGLACVHLRFGQCVFCTFEGSVGVFTAVVAICNFG